MWNFCENLSMAGPPTRQNHHFGERLRRLRGSKSQREIAEALQMPPTTYASLERQEDIPRGEMLRRLTGFFKVPVNYFYPSDPTRSDQLAKAWLGALRQ